MAEDRRGRRVEDLPDWARRFYEDYGSPDLDSLDDVFHGPLMDRKSGLRRDDLIEILLDRRMLPDDKDPFVRGMLVGTNRNSIDILDQNGDFRSIARDVIVEVRLVTHLRRTYIEDKELLKFEKDDIRRRSEMHEKAEKTSDGYESNLWG
ncbi:MAG: hypothetical protein CMA79_06250 [Euryarchaeota archaeon]|jgi:hypothetical protein|nr:hypothetical protein [Euryarchaeota archaeon]MEC9458141.1 hypothetical protein [Candidatus Thermoplasmatota archaeon]|tara:strand:- start:675 stop:1124 length:450 start_codon:yes stop_codon:yes gene_type:complete